MEKNGAKLNKPDYKPVTLDADRCNGCVNCMKRCPTEAIRVRDGKARIMYERCIGCGECIKACKSRAKVVSFARLSEIKNYKYSVALPSPSIYGQFANLTDINYVLTGLKRLGFNDVYEVGKGGESVCAANQSLIHNENIESAKVTKPVISTSCQAVLRLIQVSYEHLIPHLSTVISAESAAAESALSRAVSKTGLSREEIGVFLISPCPAKLFELENPDSAITGVIAFSEIYKPLLAEMNRITEPEKLTESGAAGISWAYSGGEARCTGRGGHGTLACDGIENIMSVLNELELDKLSGIDFLELNACPAGCCGGILNIENPFVARSRVMEIERNVQDAGQCDTRGCGNGVNLTRKTPIEPINVYKLSDDRGEALRKMMQIKEILKTLPGMDCGSCGAPSCHAFAEDVVSGFTGKCRFKKVNEK